MHSVVYINARFLTQDLLGVQRHAFEISKQLSAYRKFKVVLLVPRKNKINANYNFSFNIKRFGCNRGHLWEQIDLPFYLKKQGSPLLINLTNSAPIMYSNKISTIHDLSVFENKDWFSYRYIKLYKFILPKIIRTSKKILTDSFFSKNEIIKRYAIEDKKHVNVVYCANSVQINKTFQKESIDVEDYLLFVGSISKRKNLKNLIKAFIDLDKENLILKVVGSENIHLSSDIINKNKNIEYLSNVSDKKLIQLYSNAKMLIFPSFYEGFGLPPLEAMACNCPVIMSDIPVLREVYEDSALYINPYDIDDIKETISELLRDNALIDKLIKLGEKQTKKYSWKKSANKVIELIDTI